MAHIRRFLPLSQKNKNPQECYHILKIIICITVGWKKGHLTSWKPVIIVVKGSYPQQEEEVSRQHKMPTQGVIVLAVMVTVPPANCELCLPSHLSLCRCRHRAVLSLPTPPELSQSHLYACSLHTTHDDMTISVLSHFHPIKSRTDTE